MQAQRDWMQGVRVRPSRFLPIPIVAGNDLGDQRRQPTDLSLVHPGKVSFDKWNYDGGCPVDGWIG